MNDNDLERPVAVYYDASGIRREIKAEDLLDDKVLRLARDFASKKGLYDKNEWMLVTPVTPSDRIFHFRAIEQANYSMLNVHSSELHDKRVDDLAMVLSTWDHWRLGTTTWKPGLNRPQFMQIADLDYYRWQSETVRVFSRDKYVRHDVYGQSNRLSMSKFHPWIAIEVIDTHYPSEDTFDIFLELTKKLPFIVIFDFAKFKNYFFRIEKIYEGKYLPIVALMYMQDGMIWYEGKSNQINNADDFLRFAKVIAKRLRV